MKKRNNKTNQQSLFTVAKKIEREKDLTVKQKKYVTNVLSGMSKMQAALAAGYKETTAIAPAQNIEKPRVQEVMRAALLKIGLDEKFFADRIKEGIDQPTKLQGTGEFTIETPDYATRHKYLETGLRLAGYGTDIKLDLDIDNRQAFIMMPPEKVK